MRSTGQASRTPGHFFHHGRTEETGRYEFQGIVVGARAEISVLIEDHDGVARSGIVQQVEARARDPINMPDITIPKAHDKGADNQSHKR
jgi:hypothetical protein